MESGVFKSGTPLKLSIEVVKLRVSWRSKSTVVRVVKMTCAWTYPLSDVLL